MALRIAVLLSGSGTTLENLASRTEQGTLEAEIAVVVATRAKAFGLERARRRSIPARAVPRGDYDSSGSFNDAIHAILAGSKPDLLVLAGFLSKLELRGYDAMNIHPALIPAFSGRGFYGERVHRSVLESGVKLTGVTVHFCNEEYDQGPIILQESVPVLDDDTVESLAERVQRLEFELYPRAIQLYGEGRLRVEGRRVRIRD